MDTTGSSKEHLLIAVPVAAAVVFATTMMGGPANALDALNRLAGQLWNASVAWLNAAF